MELCENGELPPYDETEATHYVGTESLAAVSARARSPADDPRGHRTSDDLGHVLVWHADVVRGFGDVLLGDFRRFDEAIAERRAYIVSAELDYQRELREEAMARARSRIAQWFQRRRTRP